MVSNTVNLLGWFGCGLFSSLLVDLIVLFARNVKDIASIAADIRVC